MEECLVRGVTVHQNASIREVAVSNEASVRTRLPYKQRMQGLLSPAAGWWTRLAAAVFCENG